MSDSTIQISIKRSVLVGFLIGIIALGVFCVYYFLVRIPAPSSDQIVKIKTSSLPMNFPAEFQAVLASTGITAIALVDKENKLRIMAPDGNARDLCGPQAKTAANGESECELATSPRGLVEVMSLNGNCGICNTGLGFPATCNTSNSRWDCASQAAGCVSTCQ